MQTGTVRIDDSFRLFFKPYKAQDNNTPAEKNSNLPVPESSFDIGLHLKKSELEARERVLLPYEAAQKEEGIRPSSFSLKTTQHVSMIHFAYF